MKRLSINIIGCGKLGTTIGRLLNHTNTAVILGIINQRVTSAQAAVKSIGTGTAYTSVSELPAANVYLICTPDDVITSVARELYQKANLPDDAIIAHTSGVYSSDILRSHDTTSYAVASIHPIRSFISASDNHMTLAGTHCALEGDPRARDILSHLFQQLGATLFTIDKKNKTLYHAASVLANNYLVTLHDHATHCFTQAGLDITFAKALASELMQSALTNLANTAHSSALTGPLQRGDVGTVKAHVAALGMQDTLAESAHLYKTLGIATLRLTLHTPEVLTQLKDVLEKH